MSTVTLASIVTLCPLCGAYARGVSVFNVEQPRVWAELTWRLACGHELSSLFYEPSAAWRPDGLDHLTLVPTPAQEALRAPAYA